MAALILEISGRHGPQYHRIDKAVVRAGRALDNDIILADPAVSPYHFVIRREQDGSYSLQSLADENGIRYNSKRVTESLSLSQLPLVFEAGRTRARILDPSHPVAPTRMIGCHNGKLCLFGHRGWALALFSLLFAFSAFDNYLSTPQRLTWDSFGEDQLIIILTALSLSLGLTIVNRMTSHRWDYSASLSFISLILIIGISLDQLNLFMDYYFTSQAPGLLSNLVWHLFIMPMALAWFLIRLNHGNAGVSILSIIVLLTPAAYIQTNETADYYGLFDTFDNKAYYSDNLSPWDIRHQQTISIDSFVDSLTSSVAPKQTETDNADL